MNIREAENVDFEAIWPIFLNIVTAGTTYAYSRLTTQVEAEHLWKLSPRKTFVAEDEGEIVGTYYLTNNHDGPGDHVCNCGFMVTPKAWGRGVASAMCKQSQQIALKLGYKAMQFNLVAETNQATVELWKKLGFDIVGRLPRTFRHSEFGFIDAFVMYK